MTAIVVGDVFIFDAKHAPGEKGAGLRGSRRRSKGYCSVGLVEWGLFTGGRAYWKMGVGIGIGFVVIRWKRIIEWMTH